MTKTDPGKRILEELSRLIRQLSRISGGPDDGPAMTATQRLALFDLVDSGPLRLNDLAERMGTSAPTASRAVDALDELGLVERHPDPTDHRACLVSITETGTELLDAMRRERAGRLALGLAHLQPQQVAALLAALPALESLADRITAKI